MWGKNRLTVRTEGDSWPTVTRERKKLFYLLEMMRENSQLLTTERTQRQCETERVYKYPFIGCQNHNSHNHSHHKRLQRSYARLREFHAIGQFWHQIQLIQRRKKVANESGYWQMWRDETGLFIQWGLLQVLSTDLLLISSEPQEKTICLQVSIS